MEASYSSELNKNIMNLLPGFHRFINPIVNTAVFEGEKLQKNQIKIIAVLFINRSLCPGEISMMLDIQKGSLTRMLRSLQALDLIRREDDRHDDRVYHLSLSSRGERFFIEHQQNCDRKFNELFSALDNQDRNELGSALSILHKYFEKIGAEQ